MMMDIYFSSLSMQNRTAAYLRNFGVDKSMTNNHSSAESLEKLPNEISNHAVQNSEQCGREERRAQ